MATPGLQRLRLLISLLPVVALACGTGDDGRGAFAAAYCDAHRPCCSVLGFPDTNQCRRAVVLSVPPTATFDKTAAADCLSGLAQATNQGQSCSDSFGEPSSCDQVFVVPPGTKAVGAACAGTYDCMPIQDGMVTCITLCQSETRGQLGSTPCFGDVENGLTTFFGSGPFPTQAFLCYAEDGLHCDGTTCVALKQPGGSCQASVECVRTAFCDVSVFQCAPQMAPGAACNGALECQPGTYCGNPSFTCDPKMDLGAVRCTSAEACTSGSCVNEVCRTPALGSLADLCRNWSP